MISLRKAAILPAVLAVLALFVPRAARSTTLAQLSLAHLTTSASAVVRAQCLGSQPFWRKGELWTVSNFQTVEIWKGHVPHVFQVWMIGGRSGPVTSYVPGVPRFRPGEDIVLFLEPTRAGFLSITAWGEGTFRIRRDPRTGELRVTQDTASMPTFNPATRRFHADGTRDLPLEILKIRVLAAAAAMATHELRRKQ